MKQEPVLHPRVWRAPRLADPPLSAPLSLLRGRCHHPPPAPPLAVGPSARRGSLSGLLTPPRFSPSSPLHPNPRAPLRPARTATLRGRAVLGAGASPVWPSLTRAAFWFPAGPRAALGAAPRLRPALRRPRGRGKGTAPAACSVSCSLLARARTHTNTHTRARGLTAGARPSVAFSSCKGMVSGFGTYSQLFLVGTEGGSWCVSESPTRKSRDDK